MAKVFNFLVNRTVVSVVAVELVVYAVIWQKAKVQKKVRAIKTMPEVLRKRDRTANDLYSRGVSKIRQPIEALFNWLIEKADIQKASKVRSTIGLTLHAYRRLTAVFVSLIF